MSFNRNQAHDAVKELLSVHSAETDRFEKIAEYTRPWTTSEAARKLNIDHGAKNYDLQLKLAKMSQTPFLNLVIDNFGQSLKVSGFYRSTGEQAPQWDVWKRNSMNARQTGLHRSALTYGTAYATVLPAHDETVKISAHSPRRFVALYGDSLGIPGTASNDEYPIIGLEIAGNHLRLYDEECIYTFGINKYPNSEKYWSQFSYYGSGNLELLDISEHGLHVTPVVKYRDRILLDGEEQFGIIEPLIGMADRINQTNYEQAISQYFAAFKQRYVIGWTPDSEEEAFRQSVASTQFFEDGEVKVGQYSETDLSGYIESRKATIQDLAAVAQVPAQSLGAQAISNISADGLAALETSKDRKASEIQTSLGESHEQLLRLTAHAMGDNEAAADFNAEVRWEETSARSFAQTVDGLGKMATMLGIPKEELWEDIPGWTTDRVEKAKAARGSVSFDLTNQAGLYFDNLEQQ